MEPRRALSGYPQPHETKGDSMKKFIQDMEERTGIHWGLMVVYMMAAAVIFMDMMIWRPN